MVESAAEVGAELEEYVQATPSPDQDQIYFLVHKLLVADASSPQDTLAFANMADAFLVAAHTLLAASAAGNDEHLVLMVDFARAMVSRLRTTLEPAGGASPSPPGQVLLH